MISKALTEIIKPVPHYWRQPQESGHMSFIVRSWQPYLLYKNTPSPIPSTSLHPASSPLGKCQSGRMGNLALSIRTKWNVLPWSGVTIQFMNFLAHMKLSLTKCMDIWINTCTFILNNVDLNQRGKGELNNCTMTPRYLCLEQWMYVHKNKCTFERYWHNIKWTGFSLICTKWTEHKYCKCTALTRKTQK